jgi:hypothetical protein
MLEPVFQMLISYQKFKESSENLNIALQKIEPSDNLNLKNLPPDRNLDECKQRLERLEGRVGFLEKISPVNLSIVLTICVTLSVIFGGTILAFLLEYLRKKFI